MEKKNDHTGRLTIQGWPQPQTRAEITHVVNRLCVSKVYMFNNFGHIPDSDNEDREEARHEDGGRWQRMREQAQEQEKQNQTSHDNFDVGIISVIISLPFWIVIQIFRHGYGKHFLLTLFLLFFAGPVIVLIVALMLKIHAEPSVFLAHWHAYVTRHPAAASWTWVIRGITQALTAG